MKKEACFRVSLSIYECKFACCNCALTQKVMLSDDVMSLAPLTYRQLFKFPAKCGFRANHTLR